MSAALEPLPRSSVRAAPDLSDVLARLAPRAEPNYVNAFNASAGLLDEHGINTPIRLAHFLGQFCQETGCGTVLFENLSYTTPSRLLRIFGVGNHTAAIRPEEVAGLLGNPEALAERVYGLGNPGKAKELGNTIADDGYRYRGGGVLQTTGGANYRRMGDLAGVDFYNAPDLIVASEHALKPAVFEWSQGSLNRFADMHDIRTITRIINGGYTDIDDRRHWTEQAWTILDGTGTPLWSAAGPDETTGWLQDALNRLGASPQLTVDGQYGPGTTAAVRWFQALAGVPIDGVAGEVTRAAIKLRLAAT